MKGQSATEPSAPTVKLGGHESLLSVIPHGGRNLRRDPTASVKVAGLRAPTSMLGGTVYIQSGDGRRSISSKDVTVKEALELESELLRAELSARANVLEPAPSEPDDLVRATVAQRRARRARSSVTFLSKRYMSAPPLPGMPQRTARDASK